MPKPPTCRKCGNPHWTTERCPVIYEFEPTVVREALTLAEGLVAAKATGLPKRDRKAYMREFMRKKRAKS